MKLNEWLDIWLNKYSKYLLKIRTYWYSTIQGICARCTPKDGIGAGAGAGALGGAKLTSEAEGGGKRTISS